MPRTSNLWISGLTRSRLSYMGKYAERDLNFYCTVSAIYSYNVLPHCVILYKKNVWVRASRCEHIILSISSTAIFSILIKKIIITWYMLDATNIPRGNRIQCESQKRILSELIVNPPPPSSKFLLQNLQFIQHWVVYTLTLCVVVITIQFTTTMALLCNAI